MTLTVASPLGELLDGARDLAKVAGVPNPAPTVIATEPLRFGSGRNARAWVELNGFKLGDPHPIAALMVAPVQVGVYSLIAHWPNLGAL